MIYSSSYFFRLDSKKFILNSLLSLQIAQSMGLDTFKGCYLNYKLHDPLLDKYLIPPTYGKGRQVCV